MALVRIFILILITTFLLSCEIDPNRKKKERRKFIEKQVDHHTDSLKMELDSLCNEYHLIHFDELVDSIIDIRLVDIRRKMNGQ